MNSIQKNQLRMYYSVKEALEDYKTQWNNFISLKTAAEVFQKAVEEIEELSKVQQHKSNGITWNKNESLKSLYEKVLEISSYLTAYAANKHDEALYERVHITNSMLTNSRESDLVVISEILHQEATKLLSEMKDYNLKQKDLDDLHKRIQLFRDLIAAPRNYIGVRSSATRRLKFVFSETNKLLRREMDKLMVKYKGTEFYDAYFHARDIIKYGNRKVKEDVKSDNA